MGVEMDIAFLDTYGIKYFSAVLVMVVASSTLLENLAKTAEVKSNIVRQEKFLDAAFINKILGAVLAIVIACFTFGIETAWLFAILAFVLTIAPFVIFKTPSARRRAAYAKLEADAVSTRLRDEKIDALIEAEKRRTLPNQGDEEDDSVRV